MAKSITILCVRLLTLALAIWAASIPWIMEWPFPVSAVCNAALVIALYTTRMVSLRGSLKSKARGIIPEGEQVRIIFPARSRVGRLPYVMLHEEFIVMLTDRRSIIQPCSIFSGRAKGSPRPGGKADFHQGKYVTVEMADGDQISAVVPITHRHDVAHWIHLRTIHR
ncbi:hypothetical protein ACRAWF_29420 [Streptomyces sp. L7]